MRLTTTDSRSTQRSRIFRKELLPPPKTFYERELGELSRPDRKGWALANCPFHNSKSHRSFSVKLDSGAFHCFGCDARGGDVVSFVMLRDDVPFKTAAQQLGAWEVVAAGDRGEFAREFAKRKKEREQAAQGKEAEHQKYIELRDELHCLGQIANEVSDRLDELLQGVTPAYPDEAEHCWEVLALVLDDVRLTEAAYMTAIGMEYTG